MKGQVKEVEDILQSQEEDQFQQKRSLTQDQFDIESKLQDELNQQKLQETSLSGQIKGIREGSGEILETMKQRVSDASNQISVLNKQVQSETSERDSIQKELDQVQFTFTKMTCFRNEQS